MLFLWEKTSWEDGDKTALYIFGVSEWLTLDSWQGVLLHAMVYGFRMIQFLSDTSMYVQFSQWVISLWVAAILMKWVMSLLATAISQDGS